MIWKFMPFICTVIFLALGQYGAEHHYRWMIVLAIPFWFAAAIGVFLAAVKERK